LLFEQQAAQMCNFGRKHQRYLVLCSTKYDKTAWASHNTFFHNNHYTKYVDQV